MSVYYAVFVLTILLCIFVPANTDKEYIGKLIIVFSPLFLFGALRVDFGLDYEAYENLYYSIKGTSIENLDESEHAELGYQVLNLVMPTWRSLLVLTSFMLCFSIVFLFYKCLDRNNLLLATCVMFIAGNFAFYTPLVSMRNGLTNAILLLSIPFIRDRRIVIVAIIAFLGASLHTSLLLFMPLAFFVANNKPISLKEILIWIGCFGGFVVLGSSSILGYSTGFMMSYFDRYEQMIEAVSAGSGYVNILVGITNLVIVGIILYTIYQNRNRMSAKENCVSRIALLYLLSPFVGAFGGARWQSYFIPFFVVCIANMYSYTWKSNVLKIGFYILIFAYFLYSFFYVWQWNNPYFVFQTYHSIYD